MTKDLIFPVHAAAARLSLLDEMLVGVFDKIWPFVGLALFGMFIYGGFTWMMSAGDPQKVAKAQGTMLWAFVGAVILAMIMVIFGTMEEILGLPAGYLTSFEIP